MNDRKPLSHLLRQKLNDYHTLGEEIANGITHGIGTAFSIAGLTLLIVIAVNQGDIRHIVSFSIYGTSLFLLYLASTLYHSFQSPHIKNIFHILDHTGIYLLIAGTYTPFMVVGIGGVFGFSMLAVIWVLAAIGITIKAFFVNRYHSISTAAYLIMGWLAIIGWQQMVENLPPSSLYLLAAGGISYSVGVIFFALERMPYNHAIWHLFVLGGSFCHFFAVINIVPA